MPSESLTDEERNLRLMGEIDKYADWQFDALAPYIKGDVLEIGAGIGTLTQRILSHPGVSSCSVTEINPLNRAALEKNLSSKCRLISGVNLETELPASFKKSFDTVISINVMEHVKDDSSFFRNCSSCLKPGGHIIKLVPAMKSLFGTVDEADRHHRSYGRGDIRRLAEENGLKVVKLNYMNLPGALGWFYHGRILRTKVHAKGDLKLFNMLVPLIKKSESVVSPPFGLSLVLVAVKP